MRQLRRTHQPHVSRRGNRGVGLHESCFRSPHEAVAALLRGVRVQGNSQLHTSRGIATAHL